VICEIKVEAAFDKPEIRAINISVYASLDVSVRRCFGLRKTTNTIH
jgi:hypothetical protein